MIFAFVVFECEPAAYYLLATETACECVRVSFPFLFGFRSVGFPTLIFTAAPDRA